MTLDQFEDSFRVVAARGVGRGDCRRFGEVGARRICDLLFVAAAVAAALRHNIIDCTDIPITWVYRRTAIVPRGSGHRLSVEPILGWLAGYPSLDRMLATETPVVAARDTTGGLRVRFARTFRTVSRGEDGARPRSDTAR
ncbi:MULTISPECIES: DUF1931 family protein [unclassified Rhodococcus (in: high G+C Gram-positive bacteria)]|jgi:hypothetical protein|uniref:DUF1931 family protein n=1 Tax=unclassified Rhodococcus (in: high G+C Gram-positive bacteria) TaxID=192944 RepID=UPI0002720243|nr:MULTISPECIES: DUF1931 family protein [unclassified Rhodococcus (in: high G+C Gram-positive bacteria)]EJJ02214.1 hypothetical protein JVH1_0236 [Rhodococcus sp. JVH1]